MSPPLQIHLKCFGQQDATGYSFSRHLVWAACHKIVECGILLALFTSKVKMAEEKLILLDCKTLSLDLNALCEFAVQAKVEKLVVEGKGKLSVIRSIR